MAAPACAPELSPTSSESRRFMTEGRSKYTDVLAQNSEQNVGHTQDTCLQECIESSSAPWMTKKMTQRKPVRRSMFELTAGIIAGIGNREPHRRCPSMYWSRAPQPVRVKKCSLRPENEPTSIRKQRATQTDHQAGGDSEQMTRERW